MIEVTRTGGDDPLEFEVIVREGKGETRHQVSVSQATCTRLSAGRHTPERCLEAHFASCSTANPRNRSCGASMWR
jgi:hypothetical protein